MKSRNEAKKGGLCKAAFSKREVQGAKVKTKRKAKALNSKMEVKEKSRGWLGASGRRRAKTDRRFTLFWKLPLQSSLAAISYFPANHHSGRDASQPFMTLTTVNGPAALPELRRCDSTRPQQGEAACVGRQGVFLHRRLFLLLQVNSNTPPAERLSGATRLDRAMWAACGQCPGARG
ncbi:hypothetical protein AOQ84DRAFT_108479 [Glonium stellatum]|uniref:Uncharacterized protein n=1 Tax=Glonium stellatum TaxID=574774 RepID=A0A8E2FA95_9PEZI|nr:hypothetical protein AOQ84DRAFT_108479 [Glonium stellatum]